MYFLKCPRRKDRCRKKKKDTVSILSYDPPMQKIQLPIMSPITSLELVLQKMWQWYTVSFIMTPTGMHVLVNSSDSDINDHDHAGLVQTSLFRSPKCLNKVSHILFF